MADRYTLPAELGGGEVEATGPNRTELGTGSEFVNCKLPSGKTLLVPLAWLTPVKPPLPPEPKVGSVVQVGEAAPGQPWLFWHRHIGFHGWRGLRDGLDYSWSDLNELGAPVLLGSSPFAEPVQLPWEVEGTIVEAKPEYGYVAISYPPAGDDRGHTHAYTPWLARDLCRAVWAAANQADKGDHE